MNIGEKIKKLRLEKFMTQAELAGNQITRNMLSLIEKGKADPSLQTLIYLADKLKVSAGYLLAEEEETVFFRKAERISEIRLAYTKGNYRICLDLCHRLAVSVGEDDELNFLMAKAALEVAKEEFFADRLHDACAMLDEAVMYASRTSYDAGHLKAEATLYFDYLENLSPSFVSEYIDESPEAYGYLPFGDEFCRYMLALRAIGEGDESFLNRYFDHAKDTELPLVKHIMALGSMEKGEYELAANHLNDILRSDVNVSGTVLYYVFGNLEDCCRKLENQKNAKLYAEARASQFEKLLS
ncbi:MAG: helix-turn-helix transcriptional regulator [Clostridia bacterium]|nr:helix-turn-helix transcriptional regulator [Clostridia bacterium]